MGKNKARHILHGVLDCLPIILIPIFMIYSQNHEINDNTLTINESYWEVCNKYETNEIQTSDDIISGNIYYMDLFTLNTDFINRGDGFVITFYKYSSVTYEATDGVMQDEMMLDPYDANNDNGLQIIAYQYFAVVYFTNNNTYVSFEMDTVTFTFENAYFVIHEGLSNFIDYIDDYGYAYNDLKSSDYSVLEYIYHENTPVVYNDTDIMSQSFYCLYNAVDKYFNMGNVFGMKNLYTWFEVNIFGGTASPSIYVEYQ